MVIVKICKNCGRESEEGKIRCPFCGYLFEDEMDSVLREMSLNLNSFKEELTAPKPQQTGISAPAQPSVSAAASADPVLAAAYAVRETPSPAAYPARISYPAPQSAAEPEDLKLEVANLKGQLTAMQGELGRLSMQRGVQMQQNPVSYQPMPAPAQPVYFANTYGYPAPVPAEGVYSQIPEAKDPAAPAYANAGKDKADSARSKRRIVLAVLTILFLAASIASFFLNWIKFEAFEGFKGFEAINHVFGIKGGEPFEAYLNIIRAHEFAGSAMIAKLCLNFCFYVVKYGVVVYAALLVLSLPILFSLGGRIRFKAWHAFFAWTSALAAVLLFAVFCWVSGFSAMTLFFLGGAAANVLRGFFLLFYK